MGVDLALVGSRRVARRERPSIGIGGRGPSQHAPESDARLLHDVRWQRRAEARNALPLPGGLSVQELPGVPKNRIAEAVMRVAASNGEETWLYVYRQDEWRSVVSRIMHDLRDRKLPESAALGLCRLVAEGPELFLESD